MTANHEKNSVALQSVFAAIFLTALKLVVGIFSSSLGILAEAAHSGFDLIAAVLTYFAVRASCLPADQQHNYGHGKIENLSALFETLLLFVTCLWISREALQRLFWGGAVEIEMQAIPYGLGVMATSIAVDYTRSRALKRVAEKYQSQALEADALHFSTDVWSSLVVICGLGLVYLAEVLKYPWLKHADAIAALGVASIVVWISWRLGKKNIDDLLDAVPSDLQAKVTRAATVRGIQEIKRVRVRRAGPEVFADMTVSVAENTPLGRSHEIASEIETAVGALIPGADVVVHIEPESHPHEGVLSTLRHLAARHGLGAHSIRIYRLPEGSTLELHLEVNETLQLKDAHDLATAFEADVRAILPQFNRIDTHLEPCGDSEAQRDASPADEALVRQALESLPLFEGLEFRPHDVQVQQVGGELSLTFHCLLDAKAGISQVHRATEQLEKILRERLPKLCRVNIHVEPDSVE